MAEKKYKVIRSPERVWLRWPMTLKIRSGYVRATKIIRLKRLRARTVLHPGYIYAPYVPEAVDVAKDFVARYGHITRNSN